MASPISIERPTNVGLERTKPKPRVTFNENARTKPQRSLSTISPRKFRCDSDFRGKRKRTTSCSFTWDHMNNKRKKGTGTIILPTKFLLGGSITDPLNLEALDKGDPDKKSAEPTIGAGFKRGSTVQVIIPPNINDPLNLDACSEDGNDELADAISRQRRRRKARKRKRRNSEPTGASYESESDNRLSTSLEVPSESLNLETSATKKVGLSLSLVNARKAIKNNIKEKLLMSPPLQRRASDVRTNNEKDKNSALNHVNSTPRQPQHKKQRTKSDDKIVSPVVPQHGAERKRHPSHHQRQNSTEKCSSIASTSQTPSSSTQPQKPNCFQYGNYNQYYGYRNINHKPDARLKVLKPEWFVGKQALDIGCNIGHITLSVGKDFSPQRIVGIDIDKKLINIAQKNVKHYLKTSHQEDQFPSSMKMLYGPLHPPVNQTGGRKFPYNVKFLQSNYVLENDALLETIRPEFDVILCFSVTKWIHLNFGDSGLMRFFRRMYKNLVPGGILVLEPQGWPSYKKKRKLTKEIHETFKQIRIFPNRFQDILTRQIGFSFCSKHSVSHPTKGFDRPIYIYQKVNCNMSTSGKVNDSLVEESVKADVTIENSSKEHSTNVIEKRASPISESQEEVSKTLESVVSRTDSTEVTEKESEVTEKESDVTEKESDVTEKESRSLQTQNSQYCKPEKELENSHKDSVTSKQNLPDLPNNLTHLKTSPDPKCDPIIKTESHDSKEEMKQSSPSEESEMIKSQAQSIDLSKSQVKSESENSLKECHEICP